MKKIVLRKCLATNSMHEQNELFRICKDKSGSIFYDPSYKANGRGAYILKSPEAILLAKKKKVLNKAFETSVDDSIYENLLMELKKGVQNGK